MVLSLFLSFLGFGSGLYHVPDHPANLVAVSFLSFPQLPPATKLLPAIKSLLVAEHSLVAKPLLVAEPRKLEPQENFEEDCYLLSCLRNMYVISFWVSSISYASSKMALMLVNLQPSNGVEMLGFSDFMNFTILSSISVFALVQSLKIGW